ISPLADLRFLLSVVRIVRSYRPDLVLSYTHKPVIYGSLAARFCRVPRVVAMITGLGYAFVHDGDMRRRLVLASLRGLYRRAMGGIDLVFFQNPDDHEEFWRQGLLSAQQKVRITNGSGVDLQEFYYVPPSSTAISFLLIARLLRDKGIAEFVGAARELRARHPSKRLSFELAGPFDTNPAALSPDEVL